MIQEGEIGRRVRHSHRGHIFALYPDEGQLLLHIGGEPVTSSLFPNGINGESVDAKLFGMGDGRALKVRVEKEVNERSMAVSLELKLDVSCQPAPPILPSTVPPRVFNVVDVDRSTPLKLPWFR